jgi:thiamine-phosphate pyrophosphorylase
VATPEPVLTLVSDSRGFPERDLPRLAREAASAGIAFLQVREKHLQASALLALARAVVEATGGSATRVIVNSRPDVAEAAGAHGVQLPEQGLPVAEVRRGFPRLLIGASRHSVAGALAAEAEGADFVLLGPAFPTPGKPERELGLPVLCEAARRLRIPLHVIGGLDETTAPAARASGAAGLAAVRLFHERDVAEAARALRGR